MAFNETELTGAYIVLRNRIKDAFKNVCKGDVANVTSCTIYKVPKGNNTSCGSSENLCEGYFAFDGGKVIAWWNFNKYVRTHFYIDIIG